MELIGNFRANGFTPELLQKDYTLDLEVESLEEFRKSLGEFREKEGFILLEQNLQIQYREHKRSLSLHLNMEAERCEEVVASLAEMGTPLWYQEESYNAAPDLLRIQREILSIKKRLKAARTSGDAKVEEKLADRLFQLEQEREEQTKEHRYCDIHLSAHEARLSPWQAIRQGVRKGGEWLLWILEMALALLITLLPLAVLLLLGGRDAGGIEEGRKSSIRSGESACTAGSSWPWIRQNRLRITLQRCEGA